MNVTPLKAQSSQRTEGWRRYPGKVDELAGTPAAVHRAPTFTLGVTSPVPMHDMPAYMPLCKRVRCAPFHGSNAECTTDGHGAVCPHSRMVCQGWTESLPPAKPMQATHAR